MADSRRHRCRAAGASSSSQPRPATIDEWILDQGKHANYVNSWQERRIMAVKFIRLDFFRFYGFQFPDLFVVQGLTNLVEQKDDDVWTNVAQLTIWDDAVKVHLGLQDFNRILEYKGVNVEGELVQAIQVVGSEIGDTTFCQMGFITRGRVLIHKDDDHPDEDEDDDIDTHMAEPVSAAAPFDAGPSTMPSSSSLSMEEHFARLSKQLEDMSLA
ncbi:hypothetical protein LR48_Vigan503s002600 [Vigna angularis]|uniref:Uncharacterized protein n=1 Tax=Phaseolus angularis TaxID=3914 RepID=A0A0L9TCP8_PHAAN|nr:hypothetical protein LR48_Vigan503s002600 [Vigna angularis]